MLYIKKVEVFDIGQYVCRVINVVGWDDKNFYFNVYVLFSIEGFEREVIVEIISNFVMLICDVIGILFFMIVWLKNYKYIENFDLLEVYILFGGSKFQIVWFQCLDSGNYICIVLNMEGRVQKYYFFLI